MPSNSEIIVLLNAKHLCSTNNAPEYAIAMGIPISIKFRFKTFLFIIDYTVTMCLSHLAESSD